VKVARNFELMHETLLKKIEC